MGVRAPPAGLLMPCTWDFLSVIFRFMDIYLTLWVMTNICFIAQIVQASLIVSWAASCVVLTCPQSFLPFLYFLIFWSHMILQLICFCFLILQTEFPFLQGALVSFGGTVLIKPDLCDMCLLLLDVTPIRAPQWTRLINTYVYISPCAHVFKFIAISITCKYEEIHEFILISSAQIWPYGVHFSSTPT